MNFDKMSYLFWSVIVLILILGAGIFSNYGNKISNDKNFQTYFGWYIGILVANLFNILINLIFHFFMKDIEGKRGLKGEPGKKGLEGKDDICFCDGNVKPTDENSNLVNNGIAQATPITNEESSTKIGTLLTQGKIKSGIQLETIGVPN